MWLLGKKANKKKKKQEEEEEKYCREQYTILFAHRHFGFVNYLFSQ